MRVRWVFAVAHLDAGQRGCRAVAGEDVEEREVAVAVVDIVVSRLNGRRERGGGRVGWGGRKREEERETGRKRRSGAESG